ncbi:bifunctional 2-polyprenyl-6-hydroxyphenol methylase/3-demethylubiquinol 3-O-methyltransferase UbiG [Legionella brunensis]|uniref:Ubiquinone biosynthesis O-methyltransferase n=1 Tax=Legionella brunensis TaxID=29422 RepID=A0A0W0STI7_9GAMM|nr:bifunctional 2-polyprenyl-6-hydroxyphenol methylase/3-demethylubiquinol 3-O-methyltransferase UbiG [Legionella brunensis]KTC86595.1 3-demethylubiquinone-9 3-methyltransferase [Legionella brunensis]
MNTKSTVDLREIAKFSSHAADWWDMEGPLKTLHDINPVRLRFIMRTCSLKNKKVLDVGCGGGILSEAMAIEGAKVTGLDMASDALEVARVHALENKLSIDYVCCQIEDYDSEKFDVITCMEMLEHVPEPQTIISHCARLLKPGGYLFLSTINRTIKAYTTAILAAEYLLGILPRQTHDFDKFIKPSELAAMIRVAEMELSSMTGMTYNPWTRTASLCDSVDVNYLVSCLRP